MSTLKDFTAKQLADELDRRAKDDDDDGELESLVEAWAGGYGWVAEEEASVDPALTHLSDWERDELARAVKAADLPRVLEVLSGAEIVEA